MYKYLIVQEEDHSAGSEASFGPADTASLIRYS